MNTMISFCGLSCDTCPAFIATLTNDDNKRAEIAEQWSKEYNTEIKPEDINCDGCTCISGRHINHCNVCEIRKCALEKKVTNCGYCADYACDKLDFIFNAAPDAKKRLDEIHTNL